MQWYLKSSLEGGDVEGEEEEGSVIAVCLRERQRGKRRPDVVESVPDDPTYNVSSELTLEVSRSDDKALITCAVDHPSLAPGDKRSERALQVLCESTGKMGRNSPDVRITPESNLPREGEKFHLQCVGNGNPDLDTTRTPPYSHTYTMNLQPTIAIDPLSSPPCLYPSIPPSSGISPPQCHSRLVHSSSSCHDASLPSSSASSSPCPFL
ncbi:hypothetical protein FQN60_016655 [Etheostoma spectabile]|uniref:Ig-like domain-containing protein n=1 Tax=Etheostoma spectabile TaxID=54343 RepID=A0A5J5D3X6_9PERO|nr:hypothetical protein FQN60_016655 [Etheostoma spectabile]